MTPRKSVAAFHEAGHAVALFAAFAALGRCDLPFSRIVIDTTGRTAERLGAGPDVFAFVECGKPVYSPTNYGPILGKPELLARIMPAAEWQAIVCVAGLIAQVRRQRWPRSPARVLDSARFLGGAQSDLELLDACRADFPALDIPQITTRACKLLNARWSKVEAMATALIERSEISGGEALAIAL